MFIIFVLVITFSRGSFHEIAGLGIGLAFLTHLFINIQWVKKVSLRLFDAQLSGKTRFGYWLNLTLFISLLFTIASGILISKFLFPGIGVHQSFKGIHSMMANISLVLVGIHIGLHWEGIVSRAKQVFKAKPSKLIGSIAIFVIMLLLLFGGYKLVAQQISTTSAKDSFPVMGQQVQQNQHYGDSESGVSRDNNTSINEYSDRRSPRSNNSFKKEHGSSNPLSVILYASVIIAIAAVTRALKIKQLKR